MDAMDKLPMPSDDPTITLTIRLIMQGKEVGSIIGKKGEIVKRFREESGAKINISDGSCPERIVTVTGPTNAIFKAFTLICKKFEEFQEMQGGPNGSGIPRPPITLRLIVPASQCGSLIGKGGSKIKEIREVTGASIQVASEMLPNSTERAVTISGTSEAITQCIYHICCVMLESPPKGATIPYRPKPQVAGPVILAGGQAYTIQGNYAVPTHSDMGMGNSPLAGLAALGLGGLNAANTGGLNPAALAALAGSQLRTNNQNRNQPGVNHQTHEMTVPNELIGCIIGKGGTKIAEIRQISGAMIRISNCEEREGGATDRTITITGNPDAVALAQYLINMSVGMQKASHEVQIAGSPSATAASAANSTVPAPAPTPHPPPLAFATPLALSLSQQLSSAHANRQMTAAAAAAAPAAATTSTPSAIDKSFESVYELNAACSSLVPSHGHGFGAQPFGGQQQLSDFLASLQPATALQLHFRKPFLQPFPPFPPFPTFPTSADVFLMRQANAVNPANPVNEPQAQSMARGTSTLADRLNDVRSARFAPY